MGKFTILALLLALTLASCGAPGDVGVQQGTIDIDNVEVIDMQSLLDEAAEESKFSVFINSNIVMKTSGDDANVLIQNSEEHGADCKVYIYLDDTNECIYESDSIPAGYKVEYAPLSRKLETGVYGCTGKIALLHSDGSEKSSISMPVTITILK